MIIYEKTLTEKNIYTGNIIEVNLQEVELKDGQTSKREIVKHPGGVAILAYKDENTILMVKQFRKPLEDVILELPAGKIEKGEDLEICARRELEEETGYKANKFKYIGKVVTSPGFCDEVIHLYKAEDLYLGNIGGDEDEYIDLYEMNIDDVKQMIKEGSIIDAKTICAFML